MSEQAIADQIERIIDRGRGDAQTVSSDGRCVDCGAEIGEDRLFVLPSAVRCVNCQSAWEKDPGR